MTRQTGLVDVNSVVLCLCVGAISKITLINQDMSYGPVRNGGIVNDIKYIMLEGRPTGRQKYWRSE